MISTREKVTNSLNVIWSIAQKDIVDALKNKGTLINIILMMGMVVFFYWISTVRPWDKSIEVIVYDEGNSGLFEGTIELSDSYEIRHIEVSSLGQMKRNMRHEHWGLIVPVDFEQILASGSETTLTGHILWAWRGKVAELETLYSAKFSELLGQPVQVEIGENIIVPSPDIDTTDVNQHILFVTLFVAITLIPALMQEEKLTKTMDALLVSPASIGQVVMGKALAGLFYVVLTGGLFFTLNWMYITNWWLALLAFLLCAMFSIGLALAVSSLLHTPQQLALWLAPLMILLIVPTALAGFSNLAPSLKVIFAWIPTTALVEVFQFAMSSHAPVDRLLFDLAIALGWTGLSFAAVVWKVRRSDR
ncbi:MAG TPA: ABC transporter permease [Anaerolineae bacterium]|nr:ABC transporter permease [Anaerolineae bacterium]